jgi:hypothetical protein
MTPDTVTELQAMAEKVGAVSERRAAFVSLFLERSANEDS